MDAVFDVYKFDIDINPIRNGDPTRQVFVRWQGCELPELPGPETRLLSGKATKFIGPRSLVNEFIQLIVGDLYTLVTLLAEFHGAGLPQHGPFGIEYGQARIEILQSRKIFQLQVVYRRDAPHEPKRVAASADRPQLDERIQSKTGRSYIIRRNGEIIAHTATYAETGKIAVVGGTIVKQEYRNLNYYMLLSNHILQQLIEEGKTAYTFSITEKMIQFHKKIHTQCSEYGKLIINK